MKAFLLPLAFVIGCSSSSFDVGADGIGMVGDAEQDAAVEAATDEGSDSDAPADSSADTLTDGVVVPADSGVDSGTDTRVDSGLVDSGLVDSGLVDSGSGLVDTGPLKYCTRASDCPSSAPACGRLVAASGDLTFAVCVPRDGAAYHGCRPSGTPCDGDLCCRPISAGSSPDYLCVRTCSSGVECSGSPTDVCATSIGAACGKPGMCW